MKSMLFGHLTWLNRERQNAINSASSAGSHHVARLLPTFTASFSASGTEHRDIRTSGCSVSAFSASCG
jgi:hypothetical protein